MANAEVLTLSVGEFVSLVNQTLEYALPIVIVEGEVSSFKVSKNRWIYFDLKDDEASVRCFGTVYHLKTPIEDGMLVKVTATPRLHQLYGFSLNIQSLAPSGEGSLRRAFELLKKKLEDEGLFDTARKRALPVIPQKVGLITSSEAAAYADFTKVLGQRWGGLEIQLANVHVQGLKAVNQIVNAINHFNQLPDPPEVIVITRGGGSLEDLQAFNSEEVARAVAGSRIPTLVGVGHETDVSLADLAADVRAATPTNAAQLLVPDRSELMRQANAAVSEMAVAVRSCVRSQEVVIREQLGFLERKLRGPNERVDELARIIVSQTEQLLRSSKDRVSYLERTLVNLDPKRLLRQGYSLARDQQGKIVRSSAQLSKGDQLVVEFYKGKVEAEVIRGTE